MAVSAVPPPPLHPSFLHWLHIDWRERTRGRRRWRCGRCFSTLLSHCSLLMWKTLTLPKPFNMLLCYMHKNLFTRHSLMFCNMISLLNRFMRFSYCELFMFFLYLLVFWFCVLFCFSARIFIFLLDLFLH